MLYCSNQCETGDSHLHRFECLGFRRNLWQSLGIVNLAFRTMLRLSFGRNDEGDDVAGQLVEADNVRRLNTNFSKLEGTDMHYYAMVGLICFIFNYFS